MTTENEVRMKKQIAILTQPLGENYGGIIQNYALQQFLIKQGFEVMTINRVADHPHSRLKILASKFKSTVKRRLLRLRDPKLLSYETVTKNNQRFMRDYMAVSPVIDSTPSIIRYFSTKRFDLVIVGSDQVWRPRYSQNIFNFYLDFLENDAQIKKIAYAASFGTDEWEYTKDDEVRCSELLQLFDGISVRENSGVLLCEKFLNRDDAVNVIDPTLLLEPADYNILIKDLPKKQGLFTYILDRSAESTAFVNSCSKTLNLEIFTNQLKYKTDFYGSTVKADYIIPPITGWLQGFRDADFILTDSFHGSIFSILNRKLFFAVVNKGRGASRFESIFKQLGLQDRLIYDVNSFDLVNLNKKIDYETVYSKLAKLKDESVKFLKHYLSQL